MERYSIYKEDRDYYQIMDGEEFVGSITRGPNKKWSCVMWVSDEVLANKVDTYDDARAAFMEWANKHPDGYQPPPGYAKVKQLLEIGELQRFNEIFEYVAYDDILRAIYNPLASSTLIFHPEDLTIKQVHYIAKRLGVTFETMLALIAKQYPFR